jgi:hypothetical protein
MVSKWEPKQFVEELRKFNKMWGRSPESRAQSLEDATDELEEILEDGDIQTINRNQRVVLMAEAFDYEVLITAEWLTQRYEVDIRCYRVALANNGVDDFFTCTREYPPPELTEIAIRRRRKREIGAAPSTDWSEALKTIENEAVAKFFQRERKWARVYQNGRFDDDIEFWNARLSEHDRIKPVGEGKGQLRLYLYNEADIEKFKRAVEAELLATEFHSGPEAEPDESEEGP